MVNFVAALSYHSCLALPAAFTQPGDCLLAEPCTPSFNAFSSHPSLPLLPLSSVSRRVARVQGAPLSPCMVGVRCFLVRNKYSTWIKEVAWDPSSCLQHELHISERIKKYPPASVLAQLTPPSLTSTEPLFSPNLSAKRQTTPPTVAKFFAQKILA